MGLATPALLPVVSQVQEGIIPSLRMLPVQFTSTALDKAKTRGLSDDWIGKITRANKTRLFMPTDFITHVNGHSTLNLKVFSEITKKISDNTYFRLKIVTSNNVWKVVTMKKNEHYFHLKEWIKDACGWRMETFRS
ncbi:hypothetical protein CGMCC3_g15872 [Colletotrichum fructicola]|nr:uncharacterized protein CGMCC3_g15872 [Colletotrichum fructicola]KAE9568017.1 hypothetical protein CGMCC3_g15872 [Colletotrichum fructicola]